MLNHIHNFPRKIKQLFILFIDAFLIIFSLFIAYSLRLGEFYLPQEDEIWLWIVAPIVAIPIFIRFGLFRAVIEYVEFKALWSIAQAVSLYTLIFGMGILIADFPMPRSVILIHWLVTVLLIGSSRMVGRFFFSQRKNYFCFKQPSLCSNVLIYGAGSSGVQLLRILAMNKEMNPVAFIDDNAALHKNTVNGLTVFSVKELEKLVGKLEIQEILLALPSASRSRVREIIAELEPLPVKLRTIPSFDELIKGKVKIEDIRDVNVDDLLGRDAVEPNNQLLCANVTNKVVMVTGAGGSIGSELCRQIVQLNPITLVLYEQSEYNLYALEKELINECSSNGVVFECIPVLGSVVDQARVEKVCKRFAVNTIYHAAAYKHVPLVEMNPAVGVINNVMGTLNTAKAAIAAHVETFVLISTDKAVRPTNVMGASKRFAELVLQGLDLHHGRKREVTRFTMVRFGNVLGSSGSVVPFFRGQIKKGGPITVTHKDIIRYFMTIPEAAQLVIQAGALGKGGDVFVLDMGEPVRIYDLAIHMVKLSGLDVRDENNPEGDIEIQVTGLRPGEKLYEELLIGDNVSDTTHPRIMRAEEEVIPWEQLQVFIDELNFVDRHNDAAKVRDVLLRVVKGYSPQCGIVDVLEDNNNGKGARQEDNKQSA